MWKDKQFIVVALAVVLFAIFASTYYVLFLDTWLDEANYGYKAWLAAKDYAQPFLDFRTKYPPFAFYFETAVQDAFGPSILASRAVSALLFLGMLALVFDIMRRRGTKWIGLLAVAMLLFHPYLLGKYVAATHYALNLFLGVGAVWLLYWERLSRGQRTFWSSVVIALAFLVRYNFLPALIVWWLFILWRWRSVRLFLLSFATSLAVIGVGVVPYYLIDAEYALSIFLVMFGPFAGSLEYLSLGGGVSGSSGYSLLHTILGESRLKMLMELFTTYFYIFVLLIFGVAYLLRERGKELWAKAREYDFLLLNLALVILLFIAHFLVGPNLHKTYSLYFLPFLVLAVVEILHLVQIDLIAKNVWDGIKSAAIPLVVVTILFTAASTAISGYDIIFFNRFDYADSDLERVKRGAEYLASVTTKEDIIWTTDDPHHVFLAGRRMFTPLINKGVEHSESDNRELLRRFDRYNTEMLFEWAREDADVIVIQKGSVKRRLSRIGAEDRLPELEALLEDKFTFVGSVENAYPLKYKRGAGVMEVWRRDNPNNTNERRE